MLHVRLIKDYKEDERYHSIISVQSLKSFELVSHGPIFQINDLLSPVMVKTYLHRAS